MANYVLIQDRHHQYMTRECPRSLHPNNNNNMLVNFYHFLYTSHRENMLTFQILNQAHPPYFPENIFWMGRRNARRCTRCCIKSYAMLVFLLIINQGKRWSLISGSRESFK